ncbi:MAG: helix-turn-helix domain-containing protein [Caulobacteraceae bacterium]|nr:helix-turn-helix domain-containing protein [Caulobacteraceae bacterium]
MAERRYTPAVIAEIVDRRLQGQSFERIARRLGLTWVGVRYHCWRLDVHPPRAPRQARKRAPVVYRGGVAVRAFSPAEDARLEALRAQGLSLGAIGRAVGRHHAVVSRRLTDLRRRAHQLAGAA